MGPLGPLVLSKALGIGFGAHLSWHDLEILTDEKGQPKVVFSEAAQHRFQNPNVLVSVSHCADYRRPRWLSGSEIIV